jgi:hypothetical protein
MTPPSITNAELTASVIPENPVQATGAAMMKSFTCPHCQRVASNRYSHVNHVARCPQNPNRTQNMSLPRSSAGGVRHCTICGLRNIVSRLYANHMATHAKRGEYKGESEARRKARKGSTRQCSICQLILASTAYAGHMGNHAKKGEYTGYRPDSRNTRVNTRRPVELDMATGGTMARNAPPTVHIPPLAFCPCCGVNLVPVLQAMAKKLP